MTPARRRLFTVLATLVSAPMPAGLPALAQNSTQAPAPSSHKFGGGGVEGDPNGAVRALGSADDNDEGKGKPSVTVPRLGGEGENRTGGLPAGTGR